MKLNENEGDKVLLVILHRVEKQVKRKIKINEWKLKIKKLIKNERNKDLVQAQAQAQDQVLVHLLAPLANIKRKNPKRIKWKECHQVHQVAPPHIKIRRNLKNENPLVKMYKCRQSR